MRTGVISLTREEHTRIDVLNKANAGFMTVKEAAEQLGISERQIQRLKKEVRENGPAALVHKNTTRLPSHALEQEIKTKILKVRKKAGYKDSNFKHFQELLSVNHQIEISYSALHRLLTSEGYVSPKKRRRFKKHRRRKRREQAGSLVQMDASPYDWLSNKTQLSLHGAIDDATGQITGLYLCKNECMLGYHEVMHRMIEIYGVPESVYADRHTIFRSPNLDKSKAIDAPSGMKVNETQFGRAMSELGITVIAARSPQAKGRIERLWGTLQSRLPVEFAINGITDIEAANTFLSTYIFAFNSELAVEPEESEGAFLPLEEGQTLNHILCIKETRILDNGQVFSYKGRQFQLESSVYSNWLPPKAEITVMTSPKIGIKAGYKNLVFETKLLKPKKKTQDKAHESTASEVDSSRFRTKNSHTSRLGKQWEQSYSYTFKEVFEIVQEIFERPYSA